MDRTVTLVVVDGAGEVRGALPPFTVGTPWWQDLEPIREAHPDLVVLRVLDGAPTVGTFVGGTVRYLVQADRIPAGLQAVDDLDHLDDALADHPLRMPWARPGGPAADLAWAARHITIDGPPQQFRSWNLSSVWRIPTERGGAAWLKCVPPFFGHEATVLQLLGPSPSLPTVIAAEGHRMLLADLPGVDGYQASAGEYIEMVETLVAIQLEAGNKQAELRAVLPDWTAPTMRARAAELIAARGMQEHKGLGTLLETWDERFAGIATCGLPETVFHGDAHPGNARIGVHPPAIFDWGDSGIGHPLLDLAVVDRHDASVQQNVRRGWLAAWERAVPGCEAGRAWRLLQPVAVMRGALVFQGFLDHIEPSERCYHIDDVVPYLARADELALHDHESES